MSSSPAFAATPDVQWTSLTAANNVYDGTGTVGSAFTAPATGSFLSFIKCKPLGTNVATVARFFLNNGSTNATAANNALIGEVQLAATTASAVGALAEVIYPLNFAIPAGYKVNVVLGTAVSAGWEFTVVGGDL